MMQPTQTPFRTNLHINVLVNFTAPVKVYDIFPELICSVSDTSTDRNNLVSLF